VSPFDAHCFATVAASLQVSPRHLLVAAARLGGADVEPTRRARVIADARAGLRAAEGVAALLATPVASFAQDELDRALGSLWRVRSGAGA
jgi:hypothetical protein